LQRLLAASNAAVQRLPSQRLRPLRFL